MRVFDRLRLIQRRVRRLLHRGIHRRAPERPERFYVIGHRGSPCKEVENTIRSFETAVEADGANGIEMDLSITKDGVVVIWHDWDPTDGIAFIRCSGLEPEVKYSPRVPDAAALRKKINELTYDEFIANYGYGSKNSDTDRVEAAIPTIDDVMLWAATKPQLEIIFLDIKVPENAIEEVPRLMRSVERAIETHGPTCMFVFETACKPVLEAMKRYNPRHLYTLDAVPASGIIIHPSKFSGVARAIECGDRFATIERPRATTFGPWGTYKNILRYDMRRRRRHERLGGGTPIDAVVCYTINAEREMRWLMRKGVDGILSDRPDLLRELAMSMGWMSEHRERSVVRRVGDGSAVRDGRGTRKDAKTQRGRIVGGARL